MQVNTAILGLGTLLLACGGVSLLAIWVGTPRLRGIGLLSASFFAGAVGSGLQLLPAGTPFLSTFCSDISLVLCFILLHIAALQLVANVDPPFWHGAVLLTTQAAVSLLALFGFVGIQGRYASVCLLIALQTCTTAVVLCRSAPQVLRLPALSTATMLFTLATINVGRVVIAAIYPTHVAVNVAADLLAYAISLAVAVGVAFGFFWMTTSLLVSELDLMASTDPLTRLYNRRVFLRWCEKEQFRCQRSGVPFSVLMVDLDHFKRVNDSFGHQAGDDVLCSAVEQMQDSVRGIDVLCRWGGEEFAVLLPNASGEAAHIVAERIRENVQKVKHLAATTPARVDEAFQMTVSIGASTYRDLDDSISEMIQRADRALYEAKTAGRNRVALAG